MPSRHAGIAIQRDMIITGVVVPAFIHNSSYFFVDIPVYADGLIDAWELLDLPLFEAKLASGWVTTRVPDGRNIDVYGLGSWPVRDGQWSSTPGDLLELVERRLRELNPELRNLYDCHGQTTREIDQVTVSILGSSRPHAVRPRDESILPRLARGRSLPVFVTEATRTYIAGLRVFEDDVFEIGRIPEPRLLSRQQLVAEVAAGLIHASPAEGDTIEIHGLGSFVVGPAKAAVEIDQILLETFDVIDELHRRPGSIQRCRARYREHLEAPSEATRLALKAAYEAVPVHKRRFVGDMDSKDVRVRMAIYGDDEIVHRRTRRVARAREIEPQPTTSVLHENADDSRDPRIRDATANDAVAIAAIYDHYVDHTVITFEVEHVVPTEMAQRIAEVQGHGVPWLVVEDHGVVVGYAYATRWRDRPAYRFSTEVTVYLAPGYGGRGVGTRLYTRLLELLRERGFHTAIGGIALPNEASVALHQKLGFTKVAHFAQVGFKHGQWIDVGFWQLAL